MNTDHFCFRKPITKLVHIRYVFTQNEQVVTYCNVVFRYSHRFVGLENENNKLNPSCRGNGEGKGIPGFMERYKGQTAFGH